VRGAIEDVEVIPLPDEEPRCGIVATAVVGDARLSVVTAHLGLRGQARGQLPVLLDALRARPGPRALFGDLNLDPDDVEAPGFTRVDTDPTWSTKRPRRTIDHVLLDGLHDTAAVVVPLPVSDHLAVVVEVQAP